MKCAGDQIPKPERKRGHGKIDYASPTSRHETPKRLTYGRPRRVFGVEASLARDWSEPLQAGSIPFTVKTLPMTLTAAGLGLVTFYFAVATSPAASERFRAFPRPSWREHLVGATARLWIR